MYVVVYVYAQDSGNSHYCHFVVHKGIYGEITTYMNQRNVQDTGQTAQSWGLCMYVVGKAKTTWRDFGLFRRFRIDWGGIRPRYTSTQADLENATTYVVLQMYILCTYTSCVPKGPRACCFHRRRIETKPRMRMLTLQPLGHTL